ncbi:hypothetical protein R6H00_07155, partial [Actinotignum timonense]|uniref:hypothetical protein n=1 Tax=Actinotignum timonense TaxID=1870995 RepID=UPI002A805E81
GEADSDLVLLPEQAARFPARQGTAVRIARGVRIGAHAETGAGAAAVLSTVAMMAITVRITVLSAARIGAMTGMIAGSAAVGAGGGVHSLRFPVFTRW